MVSGLSLSMAQLQVELVPAAANIDVAQVDDTASVLPGTQHVGTHGPGAVHRIVALHCGKVSETGGVYIHNNGALTLLISYRCSEMTSCVVYIRGSN